jgi:hypothetical protein
VKFNGTTRGDCPSMTANRPMWSSLAATASNRRHSGVGRISDPR